MGRYLRYIPDGGALVEVTNRTLQGRALLRPSPETNDLILGVIGRAMRLYPNVAICAMTWMSTHYHMLLWVPNAKALADFMSHVDGNVSREIARLHGWKGPFWAGRYHSALIDDDEATQVGRLQYLLANGVKEHLVERAREWPGIHSVGAILEGKTLSGTWISRTEEYAAKRRRAPHDPRDYATKELVPLTPLPCWGHLSTTLYRRNVAEVLRRVENESRHERRRLGRTVLGASAIRRQDPRRAPGLLRPSPQPHLHAVSRAGQKAMRAAYRDFAAVYREAAVRWKRGDRTALFPSGSFPPSPPFIPDVARPP